jgi:mono/diheme cytochrome c family protein
MNIVDNPGMYLLVGIIVACLTSCSATNQPTDLESKIAQQAKKAIIGGGDEKNPLIKTDENLKLGAAHFAHHCQICHGLDGQLTGVPFATKMIPPIADLSSARVQQYSDGQLKWIIENGIAYSGMPAWKDMLDEKETWQLVLFIRNLPLKGSLGARSV